ncbi:Meiosis 1 arrest protein [Geodia barretti]|uniref:Meiosis 1 arrest protein n=1 Tax=Geodia barretti TaxID=519541 RepID=A0AA35WQM7_GEOBA|nr:Meiosis 1 arrest protein [Geodia barretti]
MSSRAGWPTAPLTRNTSTSSSLPGSGNLPSLSSVTYRTGSSTPTPFLTPEREFALNAGSSPAVRPHTAKVSNAALTPQLPVYKLRAEALVQPEGVCESVLFGMPLSLRPTACWRLDWEELERNQGWFTALCRSSNKRETTCWLWQRTRN